MRYILTGGGTGGHINPAVSIAKELLKDKNNEVLYVGAEIGMEKRLVPKEGIDIKFTSVEYINKKKFPSSIYKLVKSLFQANTIIENFSPDYIIGTGGYASFPIMYVGTKKKIPSAIHSQNVFPGKVNKILSSKVDKVFVSFNEAGKYFPKAKEIIYTGLPIKEEFKTITKVEARKKLGFMDDSFVILITGGSNGALSINRELVKLYHEIEKDDRFDKIKFIHVSGKIYYDDIIKELEKNDIENGGQIKILEYAYDMEYLLNACDVLISRAGASIMSEMIASKTPSIIIPSPNVANDHQRYNTKIVSDNEIGIVLEEEDMTCKKIKNIILDLYSDSKKMDDFIANYRQIDSIDTIKIIMGELQQ